jgi:DNA-binding NarL/FixJ family response regulator
MPHSAIRVWLIEDNTAYRQTVSRIISAAEGIDCTVAFSNCETALASPAGAGVPDVILLDVGLPGMSGLDGIPQFRTTFPSAQIIVLTAFHDDDKIMRAICAGAAGYLLKMSSVDELVAAIRQVRAGGSPMDSRVARRVLELFAKLSPVRQDYGLTERERGVLELMVRGYIKKEIASELDLSVHTVDSHIRNVYDKLQVHTRSGAVAKAVTEKLI